MKQDLKESNGYIPPGGVWTAEERESYQYELTPWEAVSHDGTDDFAVSPANMRRMLGTVSVLIAALERTVTILEGMPLFNDQGERALLDSLK